MRIFPKIALIAKKRLVKVTSTTFLFRELEQSAVYQLKSRYILRLGMTFTAWKVALFGVFLVHIFPHSDWIRRDTEWKVSECEKIRNRKNPNMDTFHAVFLLVVSQWVYECFYETSIQSPRFLSPSQNSESSYQSIWLLLWEVLAVIFCCLLVR